MANRDWHCTGDDHFEKEQVVDSMSYPCGYCGHGVASQRGWKNARNNAFIRLCPQCNCPTFFPVQVGRDWGKQYPGALGGEPVGGVADDVATIYAEARKVMTVAGYNAAVMLCRKLIMHTAVEKGAKEGESFLAYVDWLVEQRYVPRGGEEWLNYIRKRGNDVNHELPAMKKDDAEGVLLFTAMLLRNTYELPAAVPSSEDEDEGSTS